MMRARMQTMPTTAAARETATAPPQAAQSFRLEYLTVEQLKTICRFKSLPVTGLKAELIEKLIRASRS